MREDKLHESRVARFLAPVLLLANLGLIAFLVIDGAEAQRFIGPGFSFVPLLFLFIRTRRPMHTWPAWLFTVKR